MLSNHLLVILYKEPLVNRTETKLKNGTLPHKTLQDVFSINVTLMLPLSPCQNNPHSADYADHGQINLSVFPSMQDFLNRFRW